jgi:triosephosphate isomerase
MALKKLVAGNWKMHGLSADLAEIEAIAAEARGYPQVDVALCVPAILIERAARAVPGFPIGGRRTDHRRPFRTPRCAARKRFRSAGEGRRGAELRP